MSIPVDRTIKCPKCGETLKFTMWQSINTMMSFARKDIISGKLFEVECGNCGQTTRVIYPILFNDLEHQVMIHYVPPERVDTALSSVKIITKMGSRARVVTSVNELREKAMIFESDLDDRVIEVQKLIAMRQVKNQLGGEKIQAMFFNTDGNLRFEMDVDGQGGYVPLNMDDYAELKEAMSPSFELFEDEYCINSKWAEAYLASLEEDDE